MPDLDSLLAEVAALWPWEALAVALALAYLALAIRESAWCWPAGIASSAIYLALFFRATLYMEALLQVFYIAIAAYGWWHWLGGADRHRRVAARPGPAAGSGRHAGGGARASLPITTWRVGQHAAALAAVGALAAVNGALLAAYTPATMPWLDALIAWGSVVTTWMVARKVLENWLYWFVIDALCVYVSMRRGLWLTAGLFATYLVMIVIGYRAWRRHMTGRPA